MDARTIYTCSLCSTESMATVTLDDPRKDITEKEQQLLRRVAVVRAQLGTEAESEDPVRSLANKILEKNVAQKLLYATCPRCHQRNPAGLAERAADRRRTRMIGSATSFAFAIATWFLPWMAFVLLAVLALVMVVSVYAASRAKSLSWRTVAPNAAFAGVMIAILYFYPRGAALWPLVLGVRFAIASPDERPWIDATSTIRFELPYR